jgi:predicted transcriptional regulator YdeE
MNIVRVEEFIVTGRRARTSNEREMKGEGVIGQLWSSGAPTASPLVAVYSEYESDKDGEYTYLLGRKIGEDETEPREGMFRTVEAGSYLHLPFAGSVSPEAVVGLWREVWAMEQEGKIRRAYKTDFELYGGAGFDLYVGIKT